MIGLITGYLYGRHKGRDEAEETLAVVLPELGEEREERRERKKIKRATRGAWLIVLALVCWFLYALGVGSTNFPADEAAAVASQQFSYDEGGARTGNISCQSRSDSGWRCKVYRDQRTGDTGYPVTRCAIYHVAGNPPIATRVRPC